MRSASASDLYCENIYSGREVCGCMRVSVREKEIEGNIRAVRETNLFKEFVHEAFLHPYSNFILLLCCLLPLYKHIHN